MRESRFNARILVWKKLPATGMALLPFILIKDNKHRHDPVLINHERIHLRQQAELLWVPVMLLYFSIYLVNRVRGQNHDDAYRNIVFEREAYAMENDLDYLEKRGRFAFFNFARRRRVS